MNVLVGPQIRTLAIAGSTFTDLTNLIVLIGTFNAAVNGYSTLRLPSASAGYVVTTGKSLKIVALEVKVRAAGAAGDLLLFGSADTDQGLQTNTAPTNPVYPAGLNTSEAKDISVIGTIAYNVLYAVPSAKYLFFYNNGSIATGTVTAYGYES